MKIADVNQTSILQNQVKSSSKDEKLWKASKEMEGVFISLLIKAMEKTVPKSSLTSSKNSLSKMMFSTVMGKEIAENGGIGMAQQIYHSLKDKDLADIKKMKAFDYSQILQHIKMPEAINDE